MNSIDYMCISMIMDVNTERSTILFTEYVFSALLQIKADHYYFRDLFLFIFNIFNNCYLFHIILKDPLMYDQKKLLHKLYPFI